MKPQRQIISRIPQRGMGPHEWGFVVQTELVKIWVETMSPTEMASYAQSCAQGLPNLELVPDELFTKLDEIILQQAETLGWRITLSELVRFRLSEWDTHPDGPEKFRQLGLAMRHSALVLQGEELAPISDPDHWFVKQQTVQELRVVLERMRVAYARVQRAPTPGQVVSLFSTTVADSPQLFPHLAANLERWLKFFEECPTFIRPLAFGDRPKPGTLYDEFFACSSGWEPDSVRQSISRLKP